MKRQRQIGVVSFLVTMFLAFPAFADHQEVKVGVNGMVCDFCAQGIKKQFEKTEGVAKIEVSLDEKRVTIRLEHGKDVTDETIRQKLKDAGYEVTSIQRSEA